MSQAKTWPAVVAKKAGWRAWKYSEEKMQYQRIQLNQSEMWESINSSYSIWQLKMKKSFNVWQWEMKRNEEEGWSN